MFKYIKSFWAFKPKTIEQEKISKIIEALVTRSDTKILTCPDTKRYFVSNESLNYFIVVSTIHVKITNHKFNVIHDIELPFFEYLEKFINSAIKKDRDVLEDIIFKNHINLLDEIIEKSTKN